jgi:hypothetical protein
VGFFFDPLSWDGSDLFLSDDEYSVPFATESVRAAFADAGIANIDFVPAAEVARGSAL